jgi:hypothetical protein
MILAGTWDLIKASASNDQPLLSPFDTLSVSVFPIRHHLVICH